MKRGCGERLQSTEAAPRNQKGVLASDKDLLVYLLA